MVGKSSDMLRAIKNLTTIVTAVAGLVAAIYGINGLSNNENKVDVAYDALREQVITLRERVAKLEGIVQQQMLLIQPNRTRTHGATSDRPRTIVLENTAPDAAKVLEEEIKQDEKLPPNLSDLVIQKAAK